MCMIPAPLVPEQASSSPPDEILPPLNGAPGHTTLKENESNLGHYFWTVQTREHMSPAGISVRDYMGAISVLPHLRVFHRCLEDVVDFLFWRVESETSNRWNEHN